MPPGEMCLLESKEMQTPFLDKLWKEVSPTSLSIILEKKRRQGSERHTKRKNQLCSKEKDVHGSMLMHIVAIVMQGNNCIDGPYLLQE